MRSCIFCMEFQFEIYISPTWKKNNSKKNSSDSYAEKTGVCCVEDIITSRRKGNDVLYIIHIDMAV